MFSLLFHIHFFFFLFQQYYGILKHTGMGKQTSIGSDDLIFYANIISDNNVMFSTIMLHINFSFLAISSFQNFFSERDRDSIGWPDGNQIVSLCIHTCVGVCWRGEVQFSWGTGGSCHCTKSQDSS